MKLTQARLECCLEGLQRLGPCFGGQVLVLTHHRGHHSAAGSGSDPSWSVGQLPLGAFPARAGSPAILVSVNFGGGGYWDAHPFSFISCGLPGALFHQRANCWGSRVPSLWLSARGSVFCLGSLLQSPQPPGFFFFFKFYLFLRESECVCTSQGGAERERDKQNGSRLQALSSQYRARHGA